MLVYSLHGVYLFIYLFWEVGRAVYSDMHVVRRNRKLYCVVCSVLGASGRKWGVFTSGVLLVDLAVGRV